MPYDGLKIEQAAHAAVKAPRMDSRLGPRGPRVRPVGIKQLEPSQIRYGAIGGQKNMIPASLRGSMRLKRG